VIEKDNIQELFSKAFENQTAPVKPELWSGVQAKMAAAGVGGTTAAVKGVSALTKWILGSAAIGTVGVITTVAVLNSSETKQPENITKQPVIIQEKDKNEDKSTIEQTSNESSTNQKQNEVINLDIDLPFIASDPLFTNRQGIEVLLPRTTQSSSSLIEKKEDVPTVVKDPIVEPKIPQELSSTPPHVEENEEPVHTVLESKMTKFPNVFSPNGDGNNDVYAIEIENKEMIKSFLVQIFNVENKIVFESNNPDFEWNGEYNNTIKEGMYFCLVTIIDASGKVIKDKQLIEARK
jgi:gliding motility-associated-like protein